MLPALCLLAAGALAVALGLFEALRAERRRVVDLTRALADAQQAGTRQDAWRAELTHDLRNSLAGLRAALHTLDAYADLDAGSATELRSAALAELGHLDHLVEGSDAEEPVDFEVTEVVRNVVSTRRATGQDVQLLGSAALVRGRPGDLATALQNLIVNAGVHAPHSPVTVRLGAGPSHVEIAVSDRGPGLDQEQAARVFARGERGPRSPGSGLGLYVARTLMRAYGGDVELRSRVGGATFVVTLPLVDRRARVPA
jgi:signal transduction histidine kinase